MKLKFKSLGVIAFLSLYMVSCKKDLQQANQLTQELKVDETKISKRPETPEEKELVANLSKTTDILKEVYKSKDALKEVNASIAAKAYTDESILIAELIYPNTGVLGESKKFKELCAKHNITYGSFAKLFWAEVAKKNDPSYKAFLENLKEDIVKFAPNSSAGNYRTNSEGGTGASIYFPYQNEFIDPNDPGGGRGGYTFGGIVTIVTATADADEGIGERSVFDANGNVVGFVPVVVNDDYAYNNPTHIIGLNGIQPYEPNQYTPYSVFPPGGPIDIPNLPRTVKQVYVGEVRVSHQYDRLISFTLNGGGSEIKFTRGDGYLKLADGQVQADVLMVNGKPEHTRGDIRKKRWLEWSAAWDEDWEVNNFEQFLAIYEDDNANSGSLNFSLKTTASVVVPGTPPVTIGAERNIGGVINYKSNDAIIKQTVYKHDVFFPLNRTDLEGEWRNSWPVRDKNGGVSFTFLDRTMF
ncbi:MAG: hypothetical protein K2X48_08420 [Chitinophagaceae bacterium]|nr:hypothetical protein [Chitinophagaceae bacterium]